MNERNLEKIQDKWLLFQRFVTSIVACAGRGASVHRQGSLSADDFLILQSVVFSSYSTAREK